MRDIEHELSKLARLADTPLAEPEPVERLRRRARGHRARRGLAATTTVVVVVGAIAGTLALTRSDDATPPAIELAAPTVLLGDIDAAVLSTVYDSDGARAPIARDVVDAVMGVSGVEAATGALQRFAMVAKVNGAPPAPKSPPRTPVLISVHEPDQIQLVEGSYPDEADELLVNADVVDRYRVGVGDELVVSSPGATLAMLEDEARARADGLAVPAATGAVRRVSGVFALPGGDVPGAPVIAVPTGLSHETATDFDRIDIVLAEGADPVATMDAVRAALPAGVALYTATELGTAEQVRGELEIQRAYWALISPDVQERLSAAEPNGQSTEENIAAYEAYRETSAQVELRVQRVQFLSPDAATLVYRIYYGGAPSPIITEPQNGEAVRIDGRWVIAASTTCRLAALVALECAGREGTVPTPPEGWQPNDTQPEITAAFTALADPDATVDARVAAVQDGELSRAVVEDGLERDRALSGTVRFLVVGIRVDGDTAQVLYGLGTTTNGPQTPYPLIGTAVRDGNRWKAAGRYACGINALAQLPC